MANINLPDGETWDELGLNELDDSDGLDEPNNGNEGYDFGFTPHYEELDLSGGPQNYKEPFIPSLEAKPANNVAGEVLTVREALQQVNEPETARKAEQIAKLKPKVTPEIVQIVEELKVQELNTMAELNKAIAVLTNDRKEAKAIFNYYFNPAKYEVEE